MDRDAQLSGTVTIEAPSRPSERRCKREQRAAYCSSMSVRDPAPLDRFFPAVYEELRRVAHRQLRDERDNHTLGTTALVHEVYLRMSRSGGDDQVESRHFFALAATAMRHVLVDSARRYRSLRRGGGMAPLVLDESAQIAESRAETMLELDQALTRLAAIEPRLAQVVECRFFGGLTEEETADITGTTARTVRRDWTSAKAWLRRELEPDP